MQNNWSDKKLLDALSKAGAQKESATRYLIQQYAYYIPTISKKTGLSQEETLDQYTDAILDMSDQVKEGKFNGNSKLSSYLYKICYFKCIDLSRKKTTNKIDYRENIPETSDPLQNTTAFLETKEEIALIQQQLDRLPSPCKRILLDWGYWGYNMTEIADRAGLANATQAKDRKYKCLKKLRILLKAFQD